MRLQGGSVASEFLIPEQQRARAPRLNERVPYTTVLTHHRKPIISQSLGLYLTLVPTIGGGPVNSNNNNEGYVLDWTEYISETANEHRKDCYDFADEVGRIGKGIFESNSNPATNSYPHNVTAFMDALARRFTEMASASAAAMAHAAEQPFNPSGEYGTGKFKTDFVDIQPGSDNQARHTVFGLVIGYAHDGNITSLGSWWRNNTSPTATALDIANAREDNSRSGLADKALNNLTVPMGESLRGPGAELRARELAGWIRDSLCAPTK